MDDNLLQSVIDIVFKGNMLYLSPALFLLLVILFADRLIGLIYTAISSQTDGRRSKY